MPINKPPLLVCLKGGRLVSLIDIKPQHNPNNTKSRYVVLYPSSTSNLNWYRTEEARDRVVLYLSSTSNHNGILEDIPPNELCYIFLLHQTTTINARGKRTILLCYIFLLHQTTTRKSGGKIVLLLCYIFLLHQTTTLMSIVPDAVCCVISFFYIKPQLKNAAADLRPRCVISFFYIKPQPAGRILLRS